MPSAAEYQRSELINQAILLARIVFGEVLLQFPEEFSFASLLSSPRRTSAAIALLMVLSTVSAYRST
jgi:hypothetical protein